MSLERLIGQFTAYTEYSNLDTFVISRQTCKDILKYLIELQNQKLAELKEDKNDEQR
jgi:hypothetical protein